MGIFVIMKKEMLAALDQELNRTARQWKPKEMREMADRLERFVAQLRVSAEIQDGKQARSFVN